MVMNLFSALSNKRGEKYTLLLALFLIGVSVAFFALLAFYLRIRAKNNLPAAALPWAFWISTAVIITSSATLHWANRLFDQENYKHYRLAVLITFFLGIGFCISQFLGWAELQLSKTFLRGNPTGAFLYVISGLHLLHLLGGLLGLLWLLVQAYRNRSYIDAYVYSLNAPNVLKIRLVTAYWHFLDALWVVLFVFFWIQSW
ncbi:MAG: cytochrome c oxidase subunit 3 [Microscillaceae bacterium]|nr:cytochrome c oxidase subunit 3 [Microscillaceae bacterium]MDW8459642.1 cytochrome c oxidase subunit 3 [Cytophagales bacterium]